jgi:hypothetical protein
MAKAILAYTGTLKYAQTYFATDEFKKLGIHDQASQIYEHAHLFPQLGDALMESLTTILIKSMCVCQFLVYVPDEITGADHITVTRKHSPSCPALRIPVIEDMSPRQIVNRQRREVLMDHRHLLILEETSSKPKRREKHTNVD